MLRVESLNVSQGDFALSADFAVQSGRHVAVIGPSGAGKSTLLGAIGGYVPIKSGRIFVEEHDVTREPPHERGVAMLFQDGNLFPHLSLAQNVGLALRPSLRPTAPERARIHAALDRVGLAGFEDRMPGDVSGGQQSRAALARVLAQAKPLVLLDEPFAALGPALRAEMLALTSALVQENGATVITITHDPKDAEAAADEVIFVDAGMAHAPRSVSDIMTDPPMALRAYLGT